VIAPVIVLFFLAQKTFIEGIATTGVKGWTRAFSPEIRALRACALWTVRRKIAATPRCTKRHFRSGGFFWC